MKSTKRAFQPKYTGLWAVEGDILSAQGPREVFETAFEAAIGAHLWTREASMTGYRFKDLGAVCQAVANRDPTRLGWAEIEEIEKGKGVFRVVKTRRLGREEGFNLLWGLGLQEAPMGPAARPYRGRGIYPAGWESSGWQARAAAVYAAALGEGPVPVAQAWPGPGLGVWTKAPELASEVAKVAVAVREFWGPASASGPPAWAHFSAWTAHLGRQIQVGDCDAAGGNPDLAARRGTWEYLTSGRPEPTLWASVNRHGNTRRSRGYAEYSR